MEEIEKRLEELIKIQNRTGLEFKIDIGLMIKDMVHLIEENKNKEKKINELEYKVREHICFEANRQLNSYIEQNNKKWEDKIKAKIEEVKDGTYDAKIVLESLLEKE